MRQRSSRCWIAAALGAVMLSACHDDRVTLGTGRGPDGGPSDAAPSGWIDRTPCVLPAPFPGYRLSPLMAWDSDRRKLIVYAGQSAGGEAMTDLWELDVDTSTWTNRTTCGASQPPPPTSPGAALVYDHARRKVVLFSGTDGEVWEWDPVGADWTSRPAPTTSRFPASAPLAAITDEARGKILVFTEPYRTEGRVLVASDAALWEWDGVAGTWLPRIEAGLPWSTSNAFPSIALDPQGAAVWLFGGWQDVNDRLWRLDTASATLTELTPAVRPSAWPTGRAGADFATDQGRGRLVMFGGLHTEFQRDLWELDPTTVTWTNRTPSNVPVTGQVLPDGVVWPTALATGETGAFGDAAAGRILRLGEQSLTSDFAPTLWVWDGAAGTWSTRLPDAIAPLWPNRDSLRLLSAWDSDRHKVIVYAPETRELWQWDSAEGSWDYLTPAGIGGWNNPNNVDPVPWPPARQVSAVAYDPSVQRFVIFGGNELGGGDGLLDDLWSWDPATQQMTSLPRSGDAWPAARGSHAMAYDPVRRRVALFGGGLPEASADLLMLNTGAGTWEQIEANGSWPAARAQPTLVLDEDRQVLVLQGGLPAPMTGGQLIFDYGFFDTWELPAGASTWTPPAANLTTLRWPSAWTAPPVAYVRGAGVLGLALAGDSFSGDLTLWRWQPTKAAWVAAGIDVPRADVVRTAVVVPDLASGGDSLLMFISGAPDRPLQDRYFAETWEWPAR